MKKQLSVIQSVKVLVLLINCTSLSEFYCVSSHIIFVWTYLPRSDRIWLYHIRELLVNQLCISLLMNIADAHIKYSWHKTCVSYSDRTWSNFGWFMIMNMVDMKWEGSQRSLNWPEPASGYYPQLHLWVSCSYHLL